MILQLKLGTLDPEMARLPLLEEEKEKLVMVMKMQDQETFNEGD